MPKVSIIVLSYNQEKYVGAALRSALDQDYPDFEIVVGDDASTDETLRVIKETVASHPRGSAVRILPPGPNLGLIRNWERVVRASCGEVLVAQAGDDISHPRRVSSLAQVFDAHSSVMAAFSQVTIIDRDGRVVRESYETGRPAFAIYTRKQGGTGFDFWSGAPVVGACAAYRRCLFEDFGPLSYAHSEDEPYVYRALLRGGVAFIPDSLLQWRWHGQNLSVGSLTREDAADETLARRAKSFLMRRKGCEQHLADLEDVARTGIVSALEVLSEKRKIETVKAIQDLEFCSISPDAGLWDWLRAAGRLLRFSWKTSKAWGYLCRSAFKRLAPVSLRLKYSRPVR